MLGDNTSDVLSEDLLNGKSNGVHDVLAEIGLDVVLFEPVVSDESALAIACGHTRIAVGLAAFKLFNVLLVIVADVFAKGGLLVEPGLFPLRTVCVTSIIWAFVPRLQDGHSVLVVLHDHEAGVGQGAIETIRVVLRLRFRPRVLCHDERVV